MELTNEEIFLKSYVATIILNLTRSKWLTKAKPKHTKLVTNNREVHQKTKKKMILNHSTSTVSLPFPTSSS